MKKPKITGGREEDYEDYYNALEAWGDENAKEREIAESGLTEITIKAEKLHDDNVTLKKRVQELVAFKNSVEELSSPMQLEIYVMRANELLTKKG